MFKFSFLARLVQPQLLTLKASIICIIVFILCSAFFLSRLEFNNAPELYYPKNSPAVLLDEQLRKEFPGDEMLVALFSGGDLFSENFLVSLNNVVQRLEKHVDVDRIFAVTTVDHISASEDGFRVEPLIPLSELNKTTSIELRNKVLQDRFTPGWLVAKDGSSLALIIRAKKMQESRQRRALESALYDAVKAENIQDRLVAVAGSVALDVAQFRSMIHDSLFFVPLVVLLGVLLLFWVVGRLVPVALGALSMIVVVLSSVALIVAIGQPYTLVSAMVPLLLAAYTTSNLLHMYAALQRMQQMGLTGENRMSAAMQVVYKPALFNMLTTVAGMISLALVPIPPVQVFAVVASAGVAIIFFVVFYFIPPLLIRYDTRLWPVRGGGFAWTRRLSSCVVRFSIRYAGKVILAVLLLFAVFFPQILKVQAESDVLKFFSPSHPLTQSTRLIEERLLGVTPIELIADGVGRDAFKSVDQLRLLKSVQDWLAKQPEIDRAVSMVDVVEEMNWAFSGENVSARTLPDNDKLLSQLLLIYDGKDLSELVNNEYQRTRILLNIHAHGANEIQSVIEKIEAHLAQTKTPGITWQIGGYGRLFSDQEDLLVVGQQQSFAGAFGQIFVILLILWRSLPVTVIGLLPNLAPLAFIFVLMGMVGIRLDMATVLIAGVVLGITVDDTIHFFHHYLERRKKGFSVVFSLVRSFEASGRAVVAISVLLVAQFLVLSGSDFQPSVHFGILAATGLLAGQILELLLLPALIVFWGRLKIRNPFLAV